MTRWGDVSSTSLLEYGLPVKDFRLTRRTLVVSLATTACTGAIGKLPRDGGSSEDRDGGVLEDAGALSDAGLPRDGEAGADLETGADREAGADAGVQPAPQGKYIFQQALLFQRAHLKSIPHTYTNSLGQSVTVAGNVATFDGSTTAGAGMCGSTQELLCAASRRPWENPGGDWIDRDGIPQGSAPFATSPLMLQASGVVTLDVSGAVGWMFRQRHWLAFFVRVRGGSCRIPGVLSGAATPCALSFADAAGATEQLDCWYTASIRRSTAYTNAQDEEIAVDDDSPGLLEFFRAGRPSERVTASGAPPARATLSIPYSAVTGMPSLEVYVVGAPVPSDLTPLPGLAAASPLDVGLIAHPSVAAALCLTDRDSNADALDEIHCGTASNLWVPNGDPYGVYSEAKMDPYLFTPTPGMGDFAAVPAPTEAERAQLMPRRLHSAKGSKFYGNITRKTAATTQDAVRVVRGDDAAARARGFVPLAPGLGALEIQYGGGAVKNGQSTFQGTTGSQAVDLRSMFREEHAGRTIDAYLRMYVLLGDGWDPTEDGVMWQYYPPTVEDSTFAKYPEELGLTPSALTWRRLDRTGKFPGGVQQVTSGHTAMEVYADPTRASGDAKRTILTGGGYSSSAGIQGYQGRWVFWQGYYKPGTPGPAVGGLALGIELYDFNGGAGLTIPSQNGVGGWDATHRSYSTHRGLGFLYPRKWYCIEMRWRMNTTKPYSLPPVGTHWLEGGHNVDGYIEWWVDGISAARTPLFAHRSSAAFVDWALQNAAGQPYDSVAGTPDRLRGISNVPPELYMGASEIVFNAYYGGRTYNDSDKYVYLNGIVASSGAYIGPMAGVSRENGGLG